MSKLHGLIITFSTELQRTKVQEAAASGGDDEIWDGRNQRPERPGWYP